jgi:cbb3-type cytochrome oxidase subunit 3
MSFLYFTHRRVEFDYENKQIFILIEDNDQVKKETINEETFLIF